MNDPLIPRSHHVLKNGGYHLEHNFGHGQQHLASLLVCFNLLAFAKPTSPRAPGDTPARRSDPEPASSTTCRP